MDREVLRATIHGVTESDTNEWLNWTERNWTESCVGEEPIAKAEVPNPWAMDQYQSMAC